jgi:hypothetical protein
LTIDSYAWVEKYYSSAERCAEGSVRREYLYTLKPLRRVKVLDIEEDEDPVVLIKRRVY